MSKLAKQALIYLLREFTERMKISGKLDALDKKIISLCDPIGWS